MKIQTKIILRIEMSKNHLRKTNNLEHALVCTLDTLNLTHYLYLLIRKHIQSICTALSIRLALND